MSAQMEHVASDYENPVITVKKDGTVLYYNAASEILLHELCIGYGDKLTSKFGEIIQRVIYKNNPEKMEVKAGNRVYLIVFSPLPEQESVHISGFDISDQKHSKIENLENMVKYQGPFNIIEEVIQIYELVWDENGQPIDILMLDVNPAYEKHSGLRQEQVMGRKSKKILPVVEKIWLNRYAEVVRIGAGMHFEEYNASLDKWFDVLATPIGGNRFIVLFSDITERKRMDESEERLKALMDHNPSLVFMKDEYGRYVYLNNAYENT